MNGHSSVRVETQCNRKSDRRRKRRRENQTAFSNFGMSVFGGGPTTVLTEVQGKSGLKTTDLNINLVEQALKQELLLTQPRP